MMMRRALSLCVECIGFCVGHLPSQNRIFLSHFRLLHRHLRGFGLVLNRRGLNFNSGKLIDLRLGFGLGLNFNSGKVRDLRLGLGLKFNFGIVRDLRLGLGLGLNFNFGIVRDLRLGLG